MALKPNKVNIGAVQIRTTQPKLTKKSFIDEFRETQPDRVVDFLRGGENPLSNLFTFKDYFKDPKTKLEVLEILIQKLLVARLSAKDSGRLISSLLSDFQRCLNDSELLQVRQEIGKAIDKVTSEHGYEDFKPNQIRSKVKKTIDCWRLEINNARSFGRQEEMVSYLLLPPLSFKEYFYLTNIDEETGVLVFPSQEQNHLLITNGLEHDGERTINRRELTCFASTCAHTHSLLEGGKLKERDLDFSGRNNGLGDILSVITSLGVCKQNFVLTGVRDRSLEGLLLFYDDLSEPDKRFLQETLNSFEHNFRLKHSELDQVDDLIERLIKTGAPNLADRLKRAGIIHPEEVIRH